MVRIASRRLGIIAVLALAALAPGRAPADLTLPQAKLTYISLGDSVAFGFTTAQDFVPSFADQGYVKPYADFLATRNGGVRPNVINLGISGESISSFFTGGQPLTPFNLNYPTPTTSQNSLFLATATSSEAAGRDVGVVSIHLGINEVLQLSTTPGFFALPPAQREALTLQTYARIRQDYATLLTEVRGLLPAADLLLLGYFNPYAAIPGLPPVVADFAVRAIPGFNEVVSGLAAEFGGHYVDTYTPFLGHEAEYTYILQPNTSLEPGRNNIHPTALGYDVIALQMQAIPQVPEPGGVTLIGIGAFALAGYGWCRRRVTVSRNDRVGN